MRCFDTRDPAFEAAFKAFLDAPRGSPADVDAAVADILAQVKAGGLEAVLRLAERFDKVKLDADSIRGTREEIEHGAPQPAPPVREAIDFAAARIRAYHQRQRPADLC